MPFTLNGLILDKTNILTAGQFHPNNPNIMINPFTGSL